MIKNKWKERFDKTFKLTIILTLLVGIFTTNYSSIIKAEDEHDFKIQLNWLDDNKQILTEPLAEQSPTSFDAKTFAYHIRYESVHEAEIGEVEIRVPRYIFNTRDGNGVELSEIGVVHSSETGGASSFRYTIDTETNEIVITNYAKINAGTLFDCDVLYKYNPGEIANGTTSEIKATVKTVEEGVEVTGESNALTTKVNTTIGSIKSFKGIENQYIQWQSHWGTPDADADKYYYVYWRTNYYMDGQSQPATITVEDIMKADDEGEIIAISQHPNTASVSETGLVFGGDLSTIQFTANSYDSRRASVGVLVRYPKEKEDNSKTTKVENTIRYTATGVDDGSVSNDYTQTYTIIDGDYEYNEFGVRISKEAISDGSVSLYNAAVTTLQNGSEFNFNRSFVARLYVEGKSIAPYKAELIDDFVSIKSDSGTAFEQLNPDDYMILSFNARSEETQMVKDPNTGKWVAQKVDSATPLKVYVRVLGVSENDGWVEITNPDPTKITYSYEDGTIPANAYQIKIVQDECVEDLSMMIDRIVYQIHPTDHVVEKSGMTGDPADSIIKATDTSATLRNEAMTYVYDNTGTRVAIPETDDYVGNDETDIQMRRDRDLAVYGSYVQRQMAEVQLGSVTMSTTAGKALQEYSNNTADASFDLRYQLSSLTTITGGGLSEQELVEMDGFAPQYHGTFYDLLPLGMMYDSSKGITVYGPRGEGYGTLDGVEVIENYRGSGRTMLVINVSYSPGYNYVESLGIVRSGFQIDVNTKISWAAAADFNNSLHNQMAFMSEEELYGELADDGSYYGEGTYLGSDELQELFSDLNNDGITDSKNVSYGQRVSTVKGTTSSEVGFQKKAKNRQDSIYSLTGATANAMDSYSYELRLTNSDAVSAKNLIFYDRLENAVPNGEEYWQGTFTGISTATASLQGADPVVYYSLNPDAPYDLDNNLDDGTNGWTTTQPDNLADVKAIAVDLRKDSENEEFILGKEESVAVTVYMNAPEEYKKDSEGNALYAYNQPHYTGITNNAGSELPADMDGNITKVELLDKVVSIRKSSNPISGSKDDPKQVALGSNISYELRIENTGNLGMTNVHMEDVLPDGLELSEENYNDIHITNNSVYYGVIHDQDGINVTREGQKLSFVFDNISAKEYLTIYVKVKVKENASGKLFDNTAKITEFNGAPHLVESNTTYHRSLNAPIKSTDQSDTSGFVQPGDIITYTLDYENDRDRATYLQMRDELPVDVIYQPTTMKVFIDDVEAELGTDYSFSDFSVFSKRLIWEFDSVPDKSKVRIEYQVKVKEDLSAGITINNIVYSRVDKNQYTYFESETTNTVNPVKTVSPGQSTSVGLGQELTYTVTYKNTSDVTQDVLIKDAIPTGTTYVNGSAVAKEGGAFHSNTDFANDTVEMSFAAVDPGEIVALEFKVTVSDISSITQVENTGTVKVDNDPEVTTNKVVNKIEQPPVKTNDKIEVGGAVKPGDTITYTLKYKNEGTASKYLEFVDELPEEVVFAGEDTIKVTLDGSEISEGSSTFSFDATDTANSTELKWIFDSLAGGKEVIITFDVKVKDTLQPVAGTEIENTLEYRLSDNDVYTETSTKNYINGVKSVDVGDLTIVESGDTLIYTIEYLNTTDVNQAVVIRDAAPAGTTLIAGSASVVDGPAITPAETGNDVEWSFPTVASQETLKVQFSVKVDYGITSEVIKNTGEIEVDGSTITTNEVKNPVNPKRSDIGEGNGVTAGDIIEYSIRHVNYSKDSQKVVITDTVPAGSTLVSDSAKTTADSIDASDIEIDGNKITWTFDEVKVNEKAEVTFKVKVNDSGVVEEIKNTGGIELDNDPLVQTNTITNPIDPKTASPAEGSQVFVGDEIEYTVRYKNNSNEEQEVLIEDTIPTGTKLVDNSAVISPDSDVTTTDIVESSAKVSWKFASVQPGKTAKVTFKVKVTEDAVNSVTNQAEITANNYKITTNELTHNAENEAEKTNDKIEFGGAVKPGDTITYTLKYKNDSNEKKYLEFVDELPEEVTFLGDDTVQVKVDGTAIGGNDGVYTYISKATTNSTELRWIFDEVAAGEEVVITFDVKVKDTLQPVVGTEIENTLEYRLSDNGAYKETSTKNYLNGLKSVDAGDLTPVKSGDTLIYTIEYMNTTDANQSVVIKDAAPTGTTLVNGSANVINGTGTILENAGSVEWTLPVVAPQEVIKVEFSVKVNENTTENVIKNTGIINVDGNDLETNEVQNPVNIKSVNPGNGNGVSVGDIVEYTIRHENYSTQNQKVVITDIVPAGTTYVADSATVTADSIDATSISGISLGPIMWTFNEVKPGEVAEVTFKVKVTGTGIEEIENTGMLKVNNDPSIKTNSVINPVEPKKASPGDGNGVNVGDKISYTVRYKNNSTEVQEVQIDDVIPTGTKLVSGSAAVTANSEVTTTDILEGNDKITWKFASVQPDETVEVTFDVIVTKDAVNVVTNTADISANGYKVITNDVKNPIEPKKSNPGNGNGVSIGEKVDYTIAHTNETTANQKVVIKDTIPAGTTLVEDSAKVTGDSINATDITVSGTTITWTFDEVQPGEKAEATFQVKVVGGSGIEEVTNAGSIQINNDPLVTTNEIIHPVAPKTATPSDGSEVFVGDEIEYNVQYKNNTDEAQEVLISDLIPNGTKLIDNSAVVTNDSDVMTTDILESNDKVTWKFAVVQPNETVKVSFKVKVTADAVDKVTNKASITAGDYEVETNNVTHSVEKEAEKTNDKVEIGGAIKPGDTITYTLKYKNESNEKKYLEFVDELPEEVDFLGDDTIKVTVDDAEIASDAGVYTYTKADTTNSKELKWIFDEVAAGEEVIITFEVKVKDTIEPVAGMEIENTLEYRFTNTGSYYESATKNYINAVKTVDVGDLTPVKSGDTLVYTLDYKNTTNANQEVVIKDSAPAGTTIVSGSAEVVSGTGTPAETDGDVEWTFATVGPQETVSVKFAVKAKEKTLVEVIKNKGLVVVDGTSRATNEVKNPLNPKDVTPGDNYGVSVGDTLDYTIRHVNYSTEDQKVIITDTVPAGTKLVAGSAEVTSGSIAASDISINGDLITWTFDKVEPNEKAEVTFKVKVVGGSGIEEVQNAGGIQVNNNPSVVTNKVTNPIDPKTATPKDGNGINVGDRIEYTVRYKNNSTEAQEVIIEDEIPVGTDLISNSAAVHADSDVFVADISESTNKVTWKFTTVQPGEEVKVVFSVVVNKDAIDVVTNEASISANGYKVKTNEIENPVELKKATPGNGNGVNVGDVIDYTIEHTNRTDENQKVVITDVVPAGTQLINGSADVTSGSIAASDITVSGTTITWTFDEVKPNEKVEVTFKVKVIGSGIEEIENAGEITVNNNPIVTTNKVTNPVEPKTANPGDGNGVNIGDKIDYTVSYKNNSTEVQEVIIDDKLPTGTKLVAGSALVGVNSDVTTTDIKEDTDKVTWKFNSVQPGETVEVTFSVIVTKDAVDEITNKANISANGYKVKTNEVKNPVEPKKATPGNGNGVNVGDTIGYSIDHTNKTSENQKVVISDTVPVGTTYVDGSAKVTKDSIKADDITVSGNIITWTFDEVKPNEKVEVTFKVKVTDPGTGEIENAGEIIVNNDPLVITNKVTNPIGVKTANPADGSGVNVGDKIDYTVRYKNNASDVQEVIIDDKLPTGTKLVAGSAAVSPNSNVTTADIKETSDKVTWKFNSIQPGETVEVTFSVIVTKDAEDVIANKADISANGYKVKTNEVTNPVESKKATPGNGSGVNVGDTIDYSIDHTNRTEDNQKVVITDTIPTGTTYVDDSAKVTKDSLKANDISVNGDLITWTFDEVKPNEKVEVTFQVKVTGESGEIENAGEIIVNDNPLVVTNKVTNPIAPKQALNEFEDGMVYVGDEIDYQISYKNNTDEAQKVVITDPIPTGTKLVSGSADASIDDVEITETDDKLTWIFDSVAPGEEISVTFSVKVTKDAVDEVKNTASIKAGDYDIASNAVTHKVASPKLELVKTSSYDKSKDLVFGSEVEYQITVTNSGNGDANNVVVRDAIPEFTKYVDGSVSNIEVNGVMVNGKSVVYDGNDYVQWEIPVIKANESVTVTFKVTINADFNGEVTNIAEGKILEKDNTGCEDKFTPSNKVVDKFVTKDGSKNPSKDPSKNPSVAPGTEGANTGDTTNLNTTTALAFISLMAIVAIIKRRKRA
ncbi:isopeptide-forming domain-containing fimbrial protein [Breznakia pachnodae]|uniref:Fimbrial isopeptide formation D2 family protein/uncharacterized repeat protein (TIGR01451 family) n=1 Tax=Breznakia pachnodae TaxID=265178 RepID=A0ABU0E2R9_9FIRM|nr:isopeptide-forming domain-containing fimbrial protein [Breznakia pachnodae]MDQ0360998.1 fimbrial isopeptide formation D2 family protein/uncharacterized repeat protein (TIGR01451 family) [Breznakia pachnodae]